MVEFFWHDLLTDEINKKLAFLLIVMVKTKPFVGTSGWYYSWNPDGFDWYIENSGLNAVELNASFYRFPFPNQVKSWSRKTPDGFRWSIKVNKLITHTFQFGERSLVSWRKFLKLFKPLDDKIDFYLFQLPPHHSTKMMEKIEKFYQKTGLGERFALEPRHNEWFNTEVEKWGKDLGLTLVSVDSPEFRWVFLTSDYVYMRVHGRGSWYSHKYSKAELEEIAGKIISRRPKREYVFFNNNHDMLNNAREFLGLLS